MTDLEHKRCLACEGGIKPLMENDINDLLKQVPDWKVDQTGIAIEREFIFKNFHQTMAFANAIAWIAHQENHHPDLKIGYKNCIVMYSTHAINGLSENDFICAAKVDALLVNE